MRQPERYAAEAGTIKIDEAPFPQSSVPVSTQCQDCSATPSALPMRGLEKLAVDDGTSDMHQNFTPGKATRAGSDSKGTRRDRANSGTSAARSAGNSKTAESHLDLRRRKGAGGRLSAGAGQQVTTQSLFQVPPAAVFRRKGQDPVPPRLLLRRASSRDPGPARASGSTKMQTRNAIITGCPAHREVAKTRANVGLPTRLPATPQSDRPASQLPVRGVHPRTCQEGNEDTMGSSNSRK